ncbi:MAG: DNA polymerase III subunit gamma/tau [Spirochaetia bacterium]|nr:DNA polymerase III subunit gamma/tau [Spirochaetia bacterium]
MVFEVTYTRKRPRTFDEIAGQEFVVSTLKNSIRSGRIAHAYLFSGPRGVGKTSAARILAKALNCTSSDKPTDTPCGECANCQEIAAGNSLDVIEIDGASNTSVNDVRRIKDEVLFSPNTCRKKVYIIDEVHMLSNSAFNALLKTIEEPPGYIVFIFATTEVHKVPATIRSRCQQFHFQLIPIEVIKKLLTEVAFETGISIDDDALFWIAKESTGSMRDAYTLFDQVISFASTDNKDSETALTLTMQLIKDKMGLVGLDVVNNLAEVLSRGNAGEAISMVHDIFRRGVSVEQVIIDLVEYFRSLLIIKQGITNESLLGNKVENFSRAVLRAYTKEQLEAAVELMLEVYRNIRFSLNQRFELELAVSRLADLHLLVSSTTLVGRIASLKDQILRGELSSPLKTASVPESTAKKHEASHVVNDMNTPVIIQTRSIPLQKSQPGTIDELKENENENQNHQVDWEDESHFEKKTGEINTQEPDQKLVEITRNHIEAVQAGLKEKVPTLAAALGKVLDWHYHGNELELIFPDAYTAQRISSSIPVLRETFFTVLKEKLKLKAVTATDHEKETASDSGLSVKNGNHTDDTVSLVKNIFRGTVVNKPSEGNK